MEHPDSREKNNPQEILRGVMKLCAGCDVYRLGRLYERGLGVEQNREEAIKWYKKSAKQGYVDAKQALKRMDAK